jgi:hypothetical protein
MLEGLKIAKRYGYKIGIVTNNYWATSEQDAKIWLKPIVNIGIDDLSISEDTFHQNDSSESSASMVKTAAKELGLNINSICIEKPTLSLPSEKKGESVIGGGVLLKGRAVEKLVDGLATKPVEQLIECKYEELDNPKRVHIDCFGSVQVCQGISIGNLWEVPLSKIIKNYHAQDHPICGPLLEGGPYKLAVQSKIDSSKGFVDECHFCYTVRNQLLNKYPEQLTPLQVYGITN